MSDPAKIYVGDIGKRIKFKTGTSLSGLSSATIYVQKPHGSSTVTTWTGTVLGAVENGLLYYNTIAGDLTVRGLYRVYIKLIFSDGRDLASDPTVFNVYDRGEE